MEEGTMAALADAKQAMEKVEEEKAGLVVTYQVTQPKKRRNWRR